jgi:hypothetical protein
MVALVVLEKDVEEEGMDEALVNLVTLPVWASWASRRRVATSPYLNCRHIMMRAAAAKPPWHPSGRGRRRSLGKRTNKLKALNARGGDLYKESANERVSSRISLKATEASLGKPRNLTGALKLEISFKSHFSSPPVEWSIIGCKA